MKYQLLLLLVVWVKFTEAVQKDSILPTLSSEEKVAQCISKHFDRFFLRYVLLVSTHTELHGHQWRSNSAVVKVNYYTGLKVLPILKKFEMFIVLLDTVHQFEVLLRTFQGTKCWNPQGQFIVSIYNNKNITEIFEVAWKYYLLNMNVIYPEEPIPRVYTYFPYNSQNCSTNFISEILFSCIDSVPIEVFPNKVPAQLNGCEIKLMAYSIPPYVLNVSANREDPKVAGLEVTVMHIIAQQLNMTERYIPHNFKHWGTVLPNGTMTNMYREVADRKVDTMFGMVPFGTPPEFLFECSFIYITDSLTWWVPTANELPRWMSLMKLFQPRVWILIIVTFPVNGLFWWLFGRTKETSNSYRIWYKSIIASWSVLLQITHVPPKSAVTRILYLFFTIFSLLLYTSHQSVLVSTLTKPHHEHQIKTVEELLESKLKFGFFPLLVNSYNDSNNSMHRRISSNFIACPMTEECLNRTAFKRDFAVVKNRRQTMYLTKKYYLQPNGKPMLYGFRGGIVYFTKFVAANGYPLLRMFDKLILRMLASGLIDKWDKDITCHHEYKEETKRRPLTIQHLLLPFVYLTIGLIVSFAVFILEIIVKKCSDKK